LGENAIVVMLAVLISNDPRLGYLAFTVGTINAILLILLYISGDVTFMGSPSGSDNLEGGEV
jgi:hypothetical protein